VKTAKLVLGIVAAAVVVLLGLHLWSYAAELVSSPSNTEVTIGCGLYVMLVICGTMIGLKIYQTIKGDKNVKG
jgi:peptidoglycan biosynthesis protein MviN/MurJ (putative lipid II flippase)